MTEIQFSFTNGLSQLIDALDGMSAEQVMPATAKGLKQSASLIQKAWTAYGYGGMIDGVKSLKHSSGKYAHSIRLERNGVFSYSIYSDSPIAAYIENGTSPFDMKEKYPYGTKSRVALKTDKNGNVRRVPYLVIPFRWGEHADGHFRNIIPEEVAKLVSSKNKEFKKSRVTPDTHGEENASGSVIERNEYKWGSRVKESDIDTSDSNSMNAVGMVTMINGSGRFTFRVISADSPKDSWINPGMEAHHVTTGLKTMLEPYIQQIMNTAVVEDVAL